MKAVELSPTAGRIAFRILCHMPRWTWRHIWTETGRIGLDPCHNFGVTWRGKRLTISYAAII